MLKFIIICIFLVLPFFALPDEALFRVMTYNIRYDNSTILSLDPNRWAMRKDSIANLIKSYDADIIGIQEGFSWQVDDLANRLSGWKWYGIGREDGKMKGEFTAIFYKPTLFDVIDKGTFWLSPTPEQPSKGWDASEYRIASWMILNHKPSGKAFFLLNTHLDHRGQTARNESMKLILNRLKDLTKGLPIIVMGDFNTRNTESMTSTPYLPENPDTILRDSRSISLNEPEGPLETFNGGGNFSIEPPLYSRIDFIFVDKKIEILTYRVLTDSQNGYYFSDHLPLLVEISTH